MVSFRVSLGLGFSLEFHLVSYRDFLSGVLNVQIGFFRASLGFHLWFLYGFTHLGFQFRVSI